MHLFHDRPRITWVMYFSGSAGSLRLHDLRATDNSRRHNHNRLSEKEKKELCRTLERISVGCTGPAFQACSNGRGA